MSVRAGLLALVVAALPLAGARADEKTPVKPLVITGGHDHHTSFYSIFEAFPELSGATVMGTESAFKPGVLAKYDVVVMYDFTRKLDEPAQKALREFVGAGKGVVVLHHALLDYQDSPWWYDETVGGSYRLSSENGQPSSAVKDDQKISVTPAGSHPVTAGIGPFEIQDEAYKRMKFSPKIHPLLTTDNPACDPVLAWVGPCETARVVAIQLGHGPTAHKNPVYRTLVHNAILWAAKKTD